LIYLSLFFTAFIAATLLPAFSEVALAASLSTNASIFLLWLSATAGNTLGSCVNWYLGREILRFKPKLINSRWFPVTELQLERAQNRFSRFGVWSLLLAWLPIVGDPLTFVAGVMKVRFGLFLCLVVVGKGVRYGVIVALVVGF
jgi:membrane protein YqaA with SNARE-associated domain